jgi:hypothetical protein
MVAGVTALISIGFLISTTSQTDHDVRANWLAVTAAGHAVDFALFAASGAVLVAVVFRRQRGLPPALAAATVIGLLLGASCSMTTVVLSGRDYAGESVAIGGAEFVTFVLVSTLAGLVVLIRPTRIAVAAVLASSASNLVLTVLAYGVGYLVPWLASATNSPLLASYGGTAAEYLICIVSAVVAVPLVCWFLVRSGVVAGREVRAGLAVGLLAGAFWLVPLAVGMLPLVVPTGKAAVADAWSFSLGLAEDGLVFLVVSAAVGPLTALVARPASRPGDADSPDS